MTNEVKEEVNGTSYVTSIRQNPKNDKKQMSIEIPHGVWINGKFSKQTPKKQPTMSVSITVLHRAHKACGKRWVGNKLNADRVVTVEDAVAIRELKRVLLAWN